MSVLYCVQQLQSYLGVTLTETQQDVLRTLLDWRETQTHGVLEGYAGTGKTTVLMALIIELACRDETKGLHLTAPTHKAAHVLNEKIQEICAAAGVGVPTQAGTIHSLLSLKPKRSRPNEPESFETSKRPKLARGGYLIIDECSMVGKFLFDYTMKCATEYGVTVLFTGDPKQLRPVNETGKSRSFGLGEKVALTEVLRHDGAVLRLATRLRTTHKYAQPTVQTDVGCESRVDTYASQDELTESWLDRVAAGHETSSPSSGVVMLCWTNKERVIANRRARGRIYGPEVPEFMAGDELVMVDALARGDTVLLANNTDIKITAAEMVEWKPVASLEFSYRCWKLAVSDFGEIYVLPNDDRAQHKKDWQQIGREISAEVDQAKASYTKLEAVLGKGNFNHPRLVQAMDKLRSSKERWGEEYYPLKEAFARVDHRYALTVHKAQGSTYPAVWISPDMLEAKEERLTLMYVSVTRASKEVHHLALQ